MEKSADIIKEESFAISVFDNCLLNFYGEQIVIHEEWKSLWKFNRKCL